MFADDATILLDGSAESFEEMMQVFEEFSHVSGLNLNYNKCTVLRIGSMRNQHDIIYCKKKYGQILWTSESAKTLGIIFHANTEKILELNYTPRINQFQNDINGWKTKH